MVMEGPGASIAVAVRQTVQSAAGKAIVLLLTPLTYAQYIARAATDPTLAPIDTYHSSRPVNAICE